MGGDVSRHSPLLPIAVSSLPRTPHRSRLPPLTPPTPPPLSAATSFLSQIGYYNKKFFVLFLLYINISIFFAACLIGTPPRPPDVTAIATVTTVTAVTAAGYIFWNSYSPREVSLSPPFNIFLRCVTRVTYVTWPTWPTCAMCGWQ